jgi:hypothetical protein
LSGNLSPSEYGRSAIASPQKARSIFWMPRRVFLINSHGYWDQVKAALDALCKQLAFFAEATVHHVVIAISDVPTFLMTRKERALDRFPHHGKPPPGVEF